MRSRSSVGSWVVRNHGEAGTHPYRAAKRLLAPAVPYCGGDCLTNGVVAHRPLELIDRVIILFVEFSFHCFPDFGRVDWTSNPADDVFNDLEAILNQHFCGPL